MKTLLLCLIYLGAAVTYSIGSLISYNDVIRNSWRLYVYGLILSNMGAILWYVLIKILNTKQDIYIAGLVWDAIMIGAFVLMPLLFYNIQFTWQIGIGLCLITLGIILIKL